MGLVLRKLEGSGNRGVDKKEETQEGCCNWGVEKKEETWMTKLKWHGCKPFNQWQHSCAAIGWNGCNTIWLWPCAWLSRYRFWPSYPSLDDFWMGILHFHGNQLILIVVRNQSCISSLIQDTVDTSDLFYEKIHPSLAKGPLKFSKGLAYLEFTLLVK